MGKCCLLVDIFCNYNMTTGTSVQSTRPGLLSQLPPGNGSGCSESKLPKENCPHTLKGEEGKNQKSTDAPNLPHQTRRSASLMTAGMPIERTMGSHIATLATANRARL